MKFLLAVALLAFTCIGSECRWGTSLVWSTIRNGAASFPSTLSATSVYTVHPGAGVSCADRHSGDISWFVDDANFVGGCALTSSFLVCPKSDAVVAIDLSTGRVAQTFQVVGASSLGAPLVASDVIVFGTTSGKVYGLDANTFEQKWSTDLGNGAVVASPTSWGANVVVGTVNGGMYVLEQSSGRLISSYAASVAANGGIHTAIVVEGETAYANLNVGSNNFIAIDLNSMNLKWKATPTTGFYSSLSPAVDVANNAVYAAAVNGGVTALKLDDGSILWTTQLSRDINVRGSISIIHGSLLAFASSSGHYIGFDFESRRQVFAFKVGKGTLSAAPAVDGTAAFFAGSGTLYEMNARCQ